MIAFAICNNVFYIQVLHPDETPLLYSLVFGEGVVNDATSIVLFRAVESIDLTQINVFSILQVLGEFVYLYFSSTVMGIVVSKFVEWRFFVPSFFQDRENLCFTK